MLQVLCQILKTENINEVQAWLVASSPSGLFSNFFIPLILLNYLEKEAVRQLITTAVKGLEDTGRIQPTAFYEENNNKDAQVNLDTLGSLAPNQYDRSH